MASSSTPGDTPDANATPIADLILAIGSIALGATILWLSADLPDAPYEPAGPALIPQIAAIVFLGLAVALLVKSLRALVRGGMIPPRWDGQARLRGARALAGMALTVAYIAAMSSGLAGFVGASLVFLLAFGMLLLGTRPRALLFVLVMAAALAFGNDYLFTRVFVVDLPRGAWLP